MHRLTIKEIAKLSGVSPSAVSIVINNKPGVSNETRQKIQGIIDYTGFTPNINSLRLFHQRSYNIALVINQDISPFEDLFYYSIARGLLKKNKEYGYNIVFTEIAVSGKQVRLPQMIERRDTDGIIVLQGPPPEVYQKIDKLEIPYVVVDSHDKEAPYIGVSVDYECAAYTSVTHLIECGHRDIAFIGKIKTPRFYAQTFNGFCRALQKEGLLLNPKWIQKDAFDEVSAYNCMADIMGSAKKPTAVFCAADTFAIGGMRWSLDNGLKLPDDLSFCSIDNILLTEYFQPRLTTINIDKDHLGEIAMDLIVSQIRGEKVSSVMVSSNDLIVRDSVKKLVTI